MSDFDPLIHALKRLRLMAILSAFDHVTFALLQERLDLNPPDLSKQIKALHDATYVQTTKTGRGPGSETWVHHDPAGRKGLRPACRRAPIASGRRGTRNRELGRP